MKTKKSKILLGTMLAIAFISISATFVHAEVTWNHKGSIIGCRVHQHCESAYAQTWCADVNGSSSTALYHYSRARMEKTGLFGRVVTDSGRCYGTGYSEALSPCADEEFTACTYYGRD